jgi:hypothetical protein
MSNVPFFLVALLFLLVSPVILCVKEDVVFISPLVATKALIDHNILIRLQINACFLYFN